MSLELKILLGVVAGAGVIVAAIVFAHQLGEGIEYFSAKWRSIRPALIAYTRRRPKMSLLVFVIVGALLGGAAGVSSWVWIRNAKDDKRTKADDVALRLARPRVTYDVRWIRGTDLEVDVRPTRAVGGNADDTRLPLFWLQNAGTASAVDVRADWEILGEPIQSVVATSAPIAAMRGAFSAGRCSYSRDSTGGTTSREAACADKASSEPVPMIPPGETAVALVLPNDVTESFLLRLLTIAEQTKSSESARTFDGPVLRVTLRATNVADASYEEVYHVSSVISAIPDATGWDREPVRTPVSLAQDPPGRTSEHVRGWIRFAVERVPPTP